MICSIPALSLLVAVACNLGQSYGAEWSYDESAADGPSKWGDSCKNDRQSPISIQKKQSVYKEMPEISFSSGYFETDEQQGIINNGHTIQVNFNPTNKTIVGGGLPSSYRLVQLHLHWGDKDANGSEHQIDNRFYSLEIHLVHFDETNYKDVASALASKTGLAVLGVMAQVGKQGNRAFQSIVDSLAAVKYKGQSSTVLKPFAAIDILPFNHDNYYRYPGSLTTPPCSESVVWTVFEKPITVTTEQLQKLREVMHNAQGDEHESKLVNNFRPLQKLNGRVVDRSFCVKDDIKSSAESLKPFALLVAAIIARTLNFI